MVLLRGKKLIGVTLTGCNDLSLLTSGLASAAGCEFELVLRWLELVEELSVEEDLRNLGGQVCGSKETRAWLQRPHTTCSAMKRLRVITIMQCTSLIATGLEEGRSG